MFRRPSVNAITDSAVTNSPLPSEESAMTWKGYFSVALTCVFILIGFALPLVGVSPDKSLLLTVIAIQLIDMFVHWQKDASEKRRDEAVDKLLRVFIDPETNEVAYQYEGLFQRFRRIRKETANGCRTAVTNITQVSELETNLGTNLETN